MNAATFESKPIWDATDWLLLEALQHDARLGYAELGRKVRLSAPAVAERVKRLEEAGDAHSACTTVDLLVGVRLALFSIRAWTLSAS